MPDRTKTDALHRTLKAQSRSAQAMMRATNEAEYLQEVCRIVVENCGRAMVWIGLSGDDAEKTVRPTAYAGFEQGYLETLKLTWADTDRGRGPTGTAIRTGKPCACRNMLTDPAFAPWRAEALKRGYASSLALPLRSEGKTFGALTIYAREPEGFSEDEVKLLSGLADDLSFGIGALRLRAAHARMEKELQSLAHFPDENPGPVLRVSNDGTILYANAATAAMMACWGCKAGDAIPEPLRRTAQETLDSGAGREVELSCGDRVFSLVFGPVADRGYVNIYGLDVTDRKRLENEVLRSRDELEMRVTERTREVVESNHHVRESQRIIQRIADTTPDIVYIFDLAQNHIMYANRRAADFMGHTLAELGQPGFSLMADRIHPDDVELVRGARARYAAADESDVIEYEYRAKRADGQWRWLLVRETLFARGPGGAPKQILGAALDITDRKEAELSRAESERKFHAVFDYTFQFIGLLKPDGVVVEINLTALRFAGADFQDVVGRPLWEARWWWASPEAQKRLRDAITEAACGRFQRYETTLHGASDAAIVADFSIKPVLDEARNVSLLIVEARDITEHKELEKEVLQAGRDERRRIGQDLHDGLGQQLAGIAMLSRVLQQKLDAKSLREAEEAKTIVELASQAAAQSRALARGLCPVELSGDGLTDALREMAANTQKVFGIPCEFQCETPVRVADGAVATNLYYIAQEAVNNAVKHSRARKITVSLNSSTEMLSVRVRDDGVGLPEDCDQAKGMGLRTMRYRADAIGAFLDVRNVPPRGAIVRCYLRTNEPGAG